MKKILNFSILWLLVAGACLLFSGVCFAEKITILYTGQTHAALYPCSCPKEPDGGVARRMTLVQKLRLENKNTLFVDAGGFFAGGAYDEHSQGLTLDKLRNEINAQAQAIVGYDALAISDEEINLGKEYLQEKIRQSKIPFVSANLKIEGAKPYVIKKAGNTTIAIIGLTNDEAKVKSSGIEMDDAQGALERAMQDAKKNAADLILVLSSLSEEKNMELLRQVKGINIIISEKDINNADEYNRVGASFLVRPVWQGRRLSKVDFDFENGQIKNFKLDQLRLSNQIPDAPEVATIVPQCFSDTDCQKDGLKGRCSSPGQLGASCAYEKPKKITLTIIQPSNYQVANQEKVIGSLKSLFPGLEVVLVDSDAKKGKALIEKIMAKLLPVYLLEKDADTQKSFQNIKERVELKEGSYYLKPQFFGGAIFVGRKKIPMKLDVFVGTKGAAAEKVFAVLKELHTRHNNVDIVIHYLAIEGQTGFSAPTGLAELEEDIRQVCVKRYHPDKYWDYALCRAKNQESSWWDMCAEQLGIDTKAIKQCSLLGEGINLLRENSTLNQELRIAGGPTYVVNNQEVFSVTGVPQIEQIEEMLGLNEVKK